MCPVKTINYICDYIYQNGLDVGKLINKHKEFIFQCTVNK